MAYPEAIQEYPESFQLFIKTIHKRIESGKNALIPIVGQTGGGKSLMAIQCMRGLYLYRFGKEPEDEEMISHVIFKAKDFMKAMNNPELKKKEVWIWDEAGIDVGHKDHASIKNRIIGWLAQTFRNLQQIVFFTVPSISFIDASVRKLLHYYVEAININVKKKVCYAKPLEMQYNIRYDKIYYHNLRGRDENAEIIEIGFMTVPKIEDELEKKYDLVKNQFTQDLNLQIQSKLESIEAKEQKEMKKSGVWESLTDKQQAMTSYLSNHSSEEASKHFGIGLRVVYSYITACKNKGVTFKSELKGNKLSHYNIAGFDLEKAGLLTIV